MKIAIIGAGIGGLGTACLLAQAGHDVTIYEKNDQVGGRAGLIEADGFKFDAGPSWYLMPKVFEHFFGLLGEDVNQLLNLKRLDPAFRVTFAGRGQSLDIHANRKQDRQTFESIEPSAGRQLEKHLNQAEYIYRRAEEHFLYKSFDSAKDFMSPPLAAEATRLQLFGSWHKTVSRHFKDPRLQHILEYPAVFLGGSPYKLPAFYGLLNHVVMDQGVFYPAGGIHAVIKTLEALARQSDVIIKTCTPVQQIVTDGGHATGVKASGKTFEFDAIISNADRHHTETALLEPAQRDHSSAYWQRRTVAPSALLIYLGVNRRYANLRHHNLLFAEGWADNFKQLSKAESWPTDPSLYVCAPSRTDPTVAPKDHENLFVLVPVAAGLKYTQAELEDFADKILAKLEAELKLTGLHKHIVYKKLFCVDDFAEQFNAFHGSGLGLAHTLRQSAAWRPKNKSRKVKNLYFVGADTHPGIGLPSCLIAAELVAKRLLAESHQ